ncbi:hypothetical protein EON64_10360, partial [archaeon]
MNHYLTTLCIYSTIENHEEILDRFYKLFESIWKYQSDFAKYIEDVHSGYYIQHSLDNILQEVEGRQLMCEALYLYGIMLLLMEERVPGFVREKLLVAMCRIRGEGALENFEHICKLCRNTGYVPGPDGKRPKNHPESIFNRFAPSSELVRLLIGRLQTDDIYLMAATYPDPAHRSTRISTQASMLYVILYFAPDILHKNKASMREIVDKHFNDNWVIATYMGTIVDLTVEWAPYAAAKSAIDNVITLNSVKTIAEANAKLIAKSIEELKGYLKEGVLQQDFLLDNLTALLNTVRGCNIAMRWRLLHRKTRSEVYRKAIDSTCNAPTIVALLLNSAQLEYVLKGLLADLLSAREGAWTDGRQGAVQRLKDLSIMFTGENVLVRVKRDENLLKWFGSLAEQVEGLSLADGGAGSTTGSAVSTHNTATGRKIQVMIAALEDVEQFEAVDTNIQIKTYLQEIRDIFKVMIRTSNITPSSLSILEVSSDLSYAWQLLPDYISLLHERIRKDPSSVVLLRAFFLKTASVLDIPLTRLVAIDSPDIVSVAAYY